MIDILNLSKMYSKEVRALDKVSLQIKKGVFGLLGPNGAGKSTLMRSIATLQQPDAGSIYFNTIDALREKEQIRNIMGYLPQEFGVYPNITAENMLDHIAVLKGIVDRKRRQEEIDVLFQITNLTEHRKKKLGGYSGGMKQRFGIAQALLGSPELIILDEPTAGLDPSERDRFHNLLSAIGEDKHVILSTHIVLDVSELCNDMAIIHNGKVMTQSPPLDAIQKLHGRVWKLVIPKPDIESASKQWSIISSRILHGMGVLKVYSESLPGPNFVSVEPDLEDVYFSFIKGYIEVRNGLVTSLV